MLSFSFWGLGSLWEWITDIIYQYTLRSFSKDLFKFTIALRRRHRQFSRIPSQRGNQETQFHLMRFTELKTAQHRLVRLCYYLDNWMSVVAAASMGFPSPRLAGKSFVSPIIYLELGDENRWNHPFPYVECRQPHLWFELGSAVFSLYCKIELILLHLVYLTSIQALWTVTLFFTNYLLANSLLQCYIWSRWEFLKLR